MIRVFEYFSGNLSCNVKLTYDCGWLCSVVIEAPKKVEAPQVKFINSQDDFIAMCKKYNVSVTEVLEDIPFEQFWEDFDHKFDKAEADKIWNKMNKADQVQAYRFIGKYKNWIFKNNGVGKKYPKTYLRQKPWIQ